MGTSPVDSRRRLIVNADDFGQSPGIDRGIMEAHRRGIVTSASLLVRGPSAAAAAAYGRRHGDLSLGLHVDLGEWSFQDGRWVPSYQVVDPHDPLAVAEEAARQLAEFRRLTGRAPTHLDSHQHAHRRGPAREVLLEMSRQLGVSLRHLSAEIRYCGDFYGQTRDGAPLPDRITVERLIAVLEAMPVGVTELVCHPGYADDAPDAMYRDEREKELRVLCDHRIRQALAEQGITLCSFHDLAG